MKVKRMPFHIVRGDSSDEEVQYSGDGEKSKDRGNVEEGGGGGGEDGGGGGGRRSEYRGGDYYEFIARAPSIRWESPPNFNHPLETILIGALL